MLRYFFLFFVVLSTWHFVGSSFADSGKDEIVVTFINFSKDSKIADEISLMTGNWTQFGISVEIGKLNFLKTKSKKERR